LDKIGKVGGGMRRGLKRFLPIVAIALLVQLLAPIGAFRVVAQMASDPLAIAGLCSGMVGAEHDQTVPAGAPHADGNCCAVCAAGLGSPPVAAPAPDLFVTLQRQYQRVVWLDAIGPAVGSRPGSNAQARAPPSPVLI
jgi:hypothetical protein